MRRIGLAMVLIAALFTAGIGFAADAAKDLDANVDKTIKKFESVIGAKISKIKK